VRRRRWGNNSAIKQSVPVRTFNDWGDSEPGYFECDMVEHCGGVKEAGNFVHTLTLTDIHSGWTECAALAVRGQSLVVEEVDAVAGAFRLRCADLDTDNDSAFMSETLQAIASSTASNGPPPAPITRTIKAWVEQKNAAVVRRLAAYGRLSGLAAAAALQRLYESARLYVNFFQPSFKLASKRREGALVHKRYHPSHSLSAAARLPPGRRVGKTSTLRAVCRTRSGGAVKPDPHGTAKAALVAE
jgi:hypothetical protein